MYMYMHMQTLPLALTGGTNLPILRVSLCVKNVSEYGV